MTLFGKMRCLPFATALAVAAIAGSGCSRAGSPASEPAPAVPPATDAAIAAQIQATVTRLAYSYPETRIFDLRFNRERTTVCGLLISPGLPPLIFSSSDATPDTVEDRKASIPILAYPGRWENLRREALEHQRFTTEVCERLGIMPGQTV